MLLSLLAATPLAAQQPLYIVNGKEVEQIASIPPEQIESVETLPADEQTVARYGARACEGVILVTLRYDTPARFAADTLAFGSYLARHIAWPDDEPAARVVVRYTVTAAGELRIGQVLESTDPRLRRRVLKVMAAAPPWEPALKEGRPVESRGVVRIQLPEGKPLRRMPELVIR